MSSEEHGTDGDPQGEPQVVVRDRRRIDPQTGQVRAATDAAASVSPEVTSADGEPNVEAELKGQLEERTADLQRLQAEYANYRKRIDRDREVVVATAKAKMATELLAVLDDIERAELHGDLTGAFKAVADKLVSTLQRVGLTPFGHEGEAFDPAVHEAVQHSTSADVAGPTVTAVLRRGYTLGDRLVRAALVAVTDHEPAAPSTDNAGEEQPVPAKDWFDPVDADTPRRDTASEQS